MSRCVKNSSEIKLPLTYVLEYEDYCKDFKSAGLVLRHKKSGARVCVLSNDDDNKCFAIGFRTTPTDGTGVPHIIEHSVLCGSDKFPVKDPFVELMKGSLNTFLNALTFPDKTIYPVASCNEADFANLMDVYMDAVLHPNIYHREEIFKQEGWHYEITDPDEPITLNGIVYSEMKGAFASPDSRLNRSLMHALFPDTTYGVESGGDPKEIPTLTYEKFLDFHKRYYHPSNSFIFLYGDIDIEEKLEWLDREYLCKYDYQPVDSEVGRQKPIGTVEIMGKYPVGPEDPIKKASYISWASMLADRSNLLKNSALDIIFEVLFNVPGAPIRDALIKAGLGQDMSAYVDTDILQPYSVVTVQNTDADRLPEFKRIVKEQLEKAVAEGLNKESLLAAVNKSEFSYCEADFGRTPKGLICGINVIGQWLYDEAGAFTSLHMKEVYDVLREKIDSDFYENIIKEYLLESKSQVFFTMVPDRELAAKDDAELKEQLAAYKASLSESEIKRLIDDTAALKAYQAEPSTPEQLRTVPLLKREDIGRKPAPIIIEDDMLAGVETKYHDIETNGIVYLKLMFDMDKLPEELIPYAGLVSRFYGLMDTSRRSYLELDNQVNIHTGGISTDVVVSGFAGPTDDYRPLFIVEARAMEHELTNMLELIGEELLDTDFSSVSRLRELLAESKAKQQYMFNNGAVRVAMQRARASISSAARYNELTGGLEAYDLICRLIDASDEEIAEVGARCRKVCEIILGKDNLTLDVTCNRELYAEVGNAIGSLTGKFRIVRDGDVNAPRRGITFDLEPKNEGIKIPGEVNYFVLSGRYKCDDPADDGLLTLINQIVSSDYIWNRIRVLGGAYGGGFSTNRNGNVGLFYSFRDPHLGATHEVFKETVKYIREFEADEREMTKYIIGTIGGIDTPLTPCDKGSRSLRLSMSGVTYEMLQKSRDAILDASIDDIHRMAGYIDQIVSEGNYSCIGSEKKITEYSEKFKSIRSLN